jgi:hypothetical protein
MMFLLRMTFWLGVVLILLPSVTPSVSSAPGDASSSARGSISATEAVSAASATVSDMRQFCTRQPDACAVGAQAAMTLGQRARVGAKMLYDFLSERYSDQSTDAVAGSNAPTKTAAVVASKPSQHTLTPADMAPAWRAPQPARKEPPGYHPA